MLKEYLILSSKIVKRKQNLGSTFTASTYKIAFVLWWIIIGCVWVGWGIDGEKQNEWLKAIRGGKIVGIELIERV